MPDIWLPKSEVKTTVSAEGRVLVWEESVFQPRPISPPTGFSTPPPTGFSTPIPEDGD